jgi:two-component system, OmpR family, sensor histidine kinase MprB
MTLRRRFALLAAVAVAVTFVLGSAIVYVVVRGELRRRVDTELRAGAAGGVAFRALLRESGMRVRPDAGAPGAPPPILAPPPPRDALGLATAYVAVIGRDGNVVLPGDGAPRLPVTGATRAVAAGSRGPFFTDATVAGTPVRVFTRPLRALPGYAVQVARPLTEVNRTLHHLALVLVLVSAGGVGLAAVLGRVVARTALTPVAQLTDAVEHVAQTSDLSRRIAVANDDEIGRLARGFNVMLAALESSIGRQRQLVADASHELRTPLTSLRTNIEVLGRSHDMPEPERRALLDDVVGQLDELAALVGDVVELAREQEPPAELEDVRFDALVAEAVTRAQRRPGAPRFALALEPCLVRGVPARLDRAVANLLDNAAKWSPPGGEVEVALRDGELTVRDHGPGIAETDLPHVFERFYRAPNARGMSGSGLGLAIVRQVAELHAGRVGAEAAPGGGALLRLALPAEPVDDGHGSVVKSLART